MSGICLLIYNLCFNIAVYLSGVGGSTAGLDLKRLMMSFPERSGILLMSLFCSWGTHMLTWILFGPHACHHVPVSCTVYQPKLLELECGRASFEEHLFRGLFTQQIWDNEKVYVVMLCMCDTGFHVAQAGLKLSAVAELPASQTLGLQVCTSTPAFCGLHACALGPALLPELQLQPK